MLVENYKISQVFRDDCQLVKPTKISLREPTCDLMTFAKENEIRTPSGDEIQI